MPRSVSSAAMPVVFGLCPWLCAAAHAEGIQFVDETSTRFPQPRHNASISTTAPASLLMSLRIGSTLPVGVAVLSSAISTIST